MESSPTEVPAVGISPEELGLLVSMTDPMPLVAIDRDPADPAVEQEALAGLVARGILVGPDAQGYLGLGRGEAGVLAGAMVADEALVLQSTTSDGMVGLALFAADGRIVCQKTDDRGHAFALVDRGWATAAARAFLTEGDGPETHGAEVVGSIEQVDWNAARAADDEDEAIRLLPGFPGFARALFASDRFVSVRRIARSAQGATHERASTLFPAADPRWFWSLTRNQTGDPMEVRRMTGGSVRQELAELIP